MENVRGHLDRAGDPSATLTQMSPPLSVMHGKLDLLTWMSISSRVIHAVCQYPIFAGTDTTGNPAGQVKSAVDGLRSRGVKYGMMWYDRYMLRTLERVLI